MKRWLSLGLIGVALLFAACGGGDGDGGGSLSVEQYFDRMQTISSDTEAAQDALPDPEGFEDFATLFDDQADILGDSLDQAKALNPPAEVEEVHNLFLQGLEDFESAARGLVGDLDGVDNAEDFAAALEASDFETVAGTFRAACSGLEAVAVANNITVDYNCGDDGS